MYLLTKEERQNILIDSSGSYSTSNSVCFRPSVLTETLIAVYFSISILEGYLSQLIGNFTRYYLIVVIAVLVMSYNKFKLRSIHFAIFSWMTLKFGSALFTLGMPGFRVFQSHLLSQIGMVAFFIVITMVRFDREFVDLIVKVILFSSFFIAVLGVFFSRSYYGAETRQVLMIFGTQIDPNNLAAFYLVGFSIAVYNIFYEKKQIMLNMVIVIINVIAISLTASRAGLVGITSVTAFVVFFQKSEFRLASFISRVVFLCVLGASFFYLLKWLLPPVIFMRLFDFQTYAEGSGRSLLWKSGIELISQRLIFGYGWGGTDLGAHNTFITLMLDNGMIGLILFMTPVFMIIKKSINKKELLAVLLLLAGLIPSFFIEAINKRFLWNSIIVAFMIISALPDRGSKSISMSSEETRKAEIKRK